MSPDDLLYTREHEWIRIAGDVGTVGVTAHAVDQLGDIVYIELPKPGDRFDAGEAFGNIESVKAVSELFIPVAGEVVEVNEAIGSDPEKLGSDPYDAGWLIKIRIRDASEAARLMSNEAYDEFTAAED